MNKALLILIVLITLKTEAQTSVLQHADSLYLNGNYSKAIEQYKTLSKTEEVFDKIAKAYIAIGNYDAALEYYQKSLEANPDDALVKYEYAKLLSKTKKFKEASTQFNELVYIDYKNPNYHYELGLVLEALNDSTAMNRFRSAYDLDQTHQKAIYKIARSHVKKRAYDQAEYFINKGLESYENNVSLISLKAQNYYNKDDYKNSKIWFQKLVKLGESSEFIHVKLSVIHAELSEYEEAIEQRKRALNFNPYDSNGLFLIGTYYERLNDYENAEKYIVQCLKLKDVPLDYEYQKLGTIYNRQQKYKEAIVSFQTALKENPDNINSAFYMVVSKDKYYADIDAKIKLYEDFKTQYPESFYVKLANMRLQELKEEKFMNED